MCVWAGALAIADRLYLRLVDNSVRTTKMALKMGIAIALGVISFVASETAPDKAVDRAQRGYL